MKKEKIKIKRYVYVLIVNDCYGDDNSTNVLGVYMNKEDAKNKMNELFSTADIGLRTVEKGKNYFCIFEDGHYNEDHFFVKIEKKEIE